VVDLPCFFRAIRARILTPAGPQCSLTQLHSRAERLLVMQASYVT
jgi:hypothetical protein